MTDLQSRCEADLLNEEQPPRPPPRHQDHVSHRKSLARLGCLLGRFIVQNSLKQHITQLSALWFLTRHKSKKSVIFKTSGP